MRKELCPIGSRDARYLDIAIKYPVLVYYLLPPLYFVTLLFVMCAVSSILYPDLNAPTNVMGTYTHPYLTAR